MKYGHVGRPSNAEVRRYKLKKVFTIYVPILCFILTFFVVARRIRLDLVMGNYMSNYVFTCSDDWDYNKSNHTCIQKYTEQSYILGDADNNSRLTYDDYKLIKNAIYNHTPLDNAELSVYDINNDNHINKKDLESFSELTGISATNGKITNKKSLDKYVCPRNLDLDGVKTKYRLNNHDQCEVSKVMDALKIKKGYKNGSYDEYKAGTYISMNGERYNVVYNSSRYQDYITLLKTDPLTTEDINKYGQSHVNRFTANLKGQVYNYSGYGSVAYYTSETCGYNSNGFDLSGCNSKYSNSDIKYIVDTWASQTFSKNELKEVDGYKARLISYADFSSIGTTNWLYNKNYSYWSMNLNDNYNNAVWRVTSDGRWGVQPIIENKVLQSEDEYTFIRPVINVKKSAFNKTYHIGDSIRIDGEKYYTVSESPKEKDYVTLLKDEPLTSIEITTYGKGHINRFNFDSPGKVVDVNGYGSVAYYTSDTCQTLKTQNLSTGCSNNYDKSDIKYIIDGWANAKFKKNSLKSVKGYKARLLDHEENNNIATLLFRYSTSYGYWTMGTDSHSNDKVWIIDNEGMFQPRNVSEHMILDTRGGKEYLVIRPVINIKKSEI